MHPLAAKMFEESLVALRRDRRNDTKYIRISELVILGRLISIYHYRCDCFAFTRTSSAVLPSSHPATQTR